MPCPLPRVLLCPHAHARLYVCTPVCWLEPAGSPGAAQAGEHGGVEGRGPGADAGPEGISLSSLCVHNLGYLPGQQSLKPERPNSLDGLEDEGDASTTSVLQAIAEAMVGVPAHVSTGGTCLLTPSSATTNPSMLGTNLLHDIDQAAQVRAP